MIELQEAIPGGVALAAAGWFGHVVIQWMRGRDSRHNTDRTVDAKLEEHWTKTTLELLDTLRDELNAAKIELANLRPMEARLAHLEEALDHIHALLASDTAAERKAAERRARAFMRRMRGEDQRGEERNELQTKISADRIKRDSESGKLDD
jgi:hypothetical protein